MRLGVMSGGYPSVMRRILPCWEEAKIKINSVTA
jgi:hypothetical protein